MSVDGRVAAASDDAASPVAPVTVTAATAHDELLDTLGKFGHHGRRHTHTYQSLSFLKLLFFNS
jgi:hypothetical protein